MLYLITIASALILGLALGGKLSHLLSLHWRGLPFLLLAASINIGGGIIAWKVAPLAPVVRVFCLFLVFGMVGYVLWSNSCLWRPALLLITIGAGMNLAVMSANSGQMPVNLDLLRAAGKPHLAQRIGEGRAFRHSKMTPETPLAYLGDTIPLPRPLSVPSPGDLFIAAGLFALVFYGLRNSPKDPDQQLGSRAPLLQEMG